MTDMHGESVRPNPSGDWPEVHPTAYIDPTAQLIGRVQVGPGVFVGPNAVIRADAPDSGGVVEPVVIEAQCNVQDGVIIHALAGAEVTIGQRTSVAHGAIVHGPCRIGRQCFVGFGAVVFRADVGDGVFIGPRAVVEDVDVPPGMAVPTAALICRDTPAQLQQTTPSQRNFMNDIVEANLELAAGYRSLIQARVDGDSV